MTEKIEIHAKKESAQGHSKFFFSTDGYYSTVIHDRCHCLALYLTCPKANSKSYSTLRTSDTEDLLVFQNVYGSYKTF